MRKLLCIVGLASTIALLGLAPTASANTATGQCTPGPCGAWMKQDVSLHWAFDPDPPTAADAGCDDQTISAEGDNTVTCTVTWDPDPPSPFDVHVLIDKTSPTVVGGVPDRTPDSGVWFNHPVTVTFGGTDGLSGIPAGGCSQVVYAGPDSPAAGVSGTCTDMAGNQSAPGSVSIAYDATPPVVAGALPSRPADFNGWYNHPVSFAFFGADATSGLAGCTSATYSGPTDSTAVVEGSCADRAGNRAASSASLRYDSTPPAPANLTIKPRSGALLLTWPSVDGVTNVVIARSQQGSSVGPVTIYSGPGHSVLDKGLQNGTKYRYTITDTDQAGNSSSQTVAAVPTGGNLLPAAGARVTSAPLLTWKSVQRATYYNVQLYRGRQKVLSTWPGTSSYQVKPAWRFKGKRYTLKPGHYRWYVWPGLGKRSKHRYGPMLGRSSFRLVAL
jgi:hypothetical protein